MLAQGPVGSSYSQLDIEQPSFPQKQTDHWSSLAVAMTVAQSSGSIRNHVCSSCITTLTSLFAMHDPEKRYPSLDQKHRSR